MRIPGRTTLVRPLVMKCVIQVPNASRSSKAGRSVRSLTGSLPLPEVTLGQVEPRNRSSCRLGPGRKGERDNKYPVMAQ